MRRLLPIIGTIAVIALFLIGSRLTSDPQERTPGRLPQAPGSGNVLGTPANAPAPATAAATPTRKPVRVPAPPTIGSSGLVTEPAPIIYLTAANATYQASLSLSGQGFEPGEDIHMILDDQDQKGGTELGWATADKDGNFGGFSFSLDWNMKPGEHKITAEGSASGMVATTTVNLLTGYPWVNPSVYSATPNQTIALKGGSFTPGEEVQVHFRSMNDPPIATIKADQYGNVDAKDVVVPFAPEGNSSFIVVGKESNAPVTVPFTILGFYPWVGLSSYTPHPQEMVGFSGQDFAPNEPVQVFLNGLGKNPIATVYSDTKGHFETAGVYEIPLELAGKNTFDFLGQKSGKPVSVAFEVRPLEPVLELTTYAGKPGTQVGFVGNGYAKGETINAYLGKVGSQPPISTFKAETDGTLKGAGVFTIPLGTAPGSLTITAVGDQSKASVTLQFEVLAFTPVALLSDYAGLPGLTIHFEGRDFAPGETVSIYLKSVESQPVATAEADENGAFKDAGEFSIPVQGKGSLSFVFVGQESGAKATVDFTVLEIQTVAPGEGIESTPGPTETPKGGAPS